MGRIFGTDGARGVAGEQLTAELALNIGRAAAQVLTQEKGTKPIVLIGEDTRISGDMLISAVTAGLCSVGADVVLVGTVPTPAVAFLVKHLNADAGVMISASHNPFEFNGIKLFGSDGFKLTDNEEELIEAIILDNAQPYDIKQGANLGQVSVAKNAVDDYIEHIKSHYTGGFKGKILVDCANGSASTTARKLFGSITGDVDIVFDNPNGININEGCGSTHIETLAKKVKSQGYEIGFAFDGDADRLLAVDEKGNVLDGDFLLTIIAKYLKANGMLKDDSIVVTTMSNLGLFKAMEKAGNKTEVTAVGDRYVLERMREKHLSLGGEQSGHVILLDWATTGDGQLSAIAIMNAVAWAKKPLSELAKELTVFPQTMINVNATASMKIALKSNPIVKEIIDGWNKKLAGNGRIVVRASGTEPYIRVMAEGESQAIINDIASEIAAAIREHLI